jgi:hypothetical protein
MLNLTSNNLIGCAGEYSVCAELCRRGVLALITPKNNPLFDVVATNPSGSDSAAIQVKTKSLKNNQGWKLGKDIETPQHNEDLFVVLVDLRDNGTDFYVYEYDILSKKVRDSYADYLRTPKRDGGQRKDVGFRWLDIRHFQEGDKQRKNRWDLIMGKLKMA